LFLDSSQLKSLLLFMFNGGLQMPGVQSKSAIPQIMLERTIDPRFSQYPVPQLGEVSFGALTKTVLPSLPQTNDAQNRRFDRELKNAWDNNPKSAKGLIGYRCAEVRAGIFRLQKKQYLERSLLKSDAALKRAEAGEARITTYRGLLTDWPKISAELLADNPEQQAEVEKRRRSVARLLTAESGVKLPTNRLLYEQSLLHGQEVFESLASCTVDSLMKRDKDGNSGQLSKNYSIVRALFEREMNAAGKDVTPEDLWRSPVVHRLVAISLRERVEEVEKSGITLPGTEKLALNLLTLAAIRGNVHRDALVEGYGLSSADARALTQRKLIPLDQIKKITGTLVEEGLIPQVVGTELEELWQATAQMSPTRQRYQSADAIFDGLARHAVDSRIIAEFVGVDHADPGFTVSKRIHDLTLSNGMFSFHAVACLAARGHQEVDDLMEEVFDDVRRMPRHAGREFSFEHQLMLQYGLLQSDLPEEFQNIEIPPYADGQEFPPETVVHAIEAEGDRRSIDLLQKWQKMMQPITPREVAQALRTKFSNLKPLVHEIGTAHSTIQRIGQGKVFPSYQLMEKIMQVGNIASNEQLRANWQLLAAEEQAESPQLGRALAVLAGRQGGDTKSLHRHLSGQSEGNPALSYSELGRLCRGFIRNQQFTRANVWEQRSAKVIAAFEQAGAEAPFIEYLKISSAREAGTAELLQWRARMEEQQRSDLVEGFDELVDTATSLARRTRPRTLQAAFERKESVMSEIAQAEQEPGQTRELSNREKALMMLPGITRAQLAEIKKSQAEG
jgi:predicted transcriptional regulator